MIYSLLSCVILFLCYRDFNLADIDQFSKKLTNGGCRPPADGYFKNT